MILCQFCGTAPEIIPIKVFYRTARRNGLHDMFRAACKCGAIDKCRPDEQSAIAAWDEPWQALVAPSAYCDAILTLSGSLAQQEPKA